MCSACITHLLQLNVAMHGTQAPAPLQAAAHSLLIVLLLFLLLLVALCAALGCCRLLWGRLGTCTKAAADASRG